MRSTAMQKKGNADASKQLRCSNFAQREKERMGLYEPYERLGFLGSGLTGLMGGMQNFGDVIKTTPDPSPLQSALGIGTSVAGILGALR